MGVEPLIAALGFPGRGDLLRGIAEDGTETVFNFDGIDKFFFNGIDTRLGDVGPDTQDVREICDLDRAHPNCLAIAMKGFEVRCLGGRLRYAL
jgi:hypothetical protein